MFDHWVSERLTHLPKMTQEIVHGYEGTGISSASCPLLISWFGVSFYQSSPKAATSNIVGS